MTEKEVTTRLILSVSRAILVYAVVIEGIDVVVIAVVVVVVILVV